MPPSDELTAGPVADQDQSSELGEEECTTPVQMSEAETMRWRPSPHSGMVLIEEEDHSRTVKVRRPISSAGSQKKMTVTLARMAEGSQDVLGTVVDDSGATLDDTGKFVVDPSSLIGTVRDYNSVAPDKIHAPTPPVLKPEDAAPAPPQPKYRRILDGLPQWTTERSKFAETRQSRHLKGWNSASTEWNKASNRLVARTGTDASKLRANCLTDHQEQTKAKELLDAAHWAAATHTHPGGLRSDPAELWARLDRFDDQDGTSAGGPQLTYKHLRDSRAGPEFWQQPEIMANSKLEMQVKHQRAIYEFISRPNAVRSELNEPLKDPDEHDSSLLGSMPRYNKFNETGDMAETYKSMLNTRRVNTQTPNPFGSVDAWVPDCSELQVVGKKLEKNRKGLKTPKFKAKVTQPITEWDRDGVFEETIEEDEDNFDDAGPAATDTHISGPFLSCRSQGDSKGLMQTSCRVIFSATVAHDCSSSMVLSNLGTTVIHFSWQRAVVKNSLGTRPDKIERFLFDRRPGVLLPGDSRTLEFNFTSPSPGVYTEPWELHTQPVLGATPLVTLCGTATLPDVHAPDRADIEWKLERHMAGIFVQSLLYDIIRKVQPSAVVPLPPAVTLQEQFVAANQDLAESVTFDQRVVERARGVYTLAWQQHWVQTNFPAPKKVVEMEPRAAGSKSGKGGGKGDKKGRESVVAGDVEVAPPEFQVLPVPEWDLSMSGLKQLLSEIEDGRAYEKEGFEWRTQDSYLAEYTELATSLSYDCVQPEPVDRMTMATELISRMVESVAASCAFARKLNGLPEPNVFVLPPPEVEVYVPRIDINAAAKGKGKPKKGGGEPDKGKGKKKGGDDATIVAPEKLSEEVAAKLQPLEIQAAREAVVKALDEWDLLLPQSDRVVALDDY